MQNFRCFDMDLVCIVMYCQDTKERGLTNKLQNVHTYALVWKKTGLLQVHRCFDLDLVCIIMYCQDTYNQLSQKK